MSEEAPKLRLRPKLQTGHPATPVPTTGDPIVIAPPTSSPELRAEPPAGSGSMPPHSGARAKPRLAGEPSSRPPMPSRPPIPGTATPPPFTPTSVTAPATSPASPALPIGLASSAKEDVPAEVLPATLGQSAPDTVVELSPLEHRARATQRTAVAICAVGVVAFAIVAYIAFPRLSARQAEFERAQDLATRFAAENAAFDEAAAKEAARLPRESASSEAPRPAAPSPSSPAAPVPSVATTLFDAPPPAIPSVIGVETVTTATGAEGSPNFQAWVKSVKIAGMRTGPNPRILIGGSSFDIGETVSIEHGITFEGYEAERRVIRFRDKSGVVLERRHP